MKDDMGEDVDAIEALIESFIREHSDVLLSDPARALLALDRLFAKLPALSGEDQKGIREALLGRLN
jgi:hypothetical protein